VLLPVIPPGNRHQECCTFRETSPHDQYCDSTAAVSYLNIVHIWQNERVNLLILVFITLRTQLSE